MNVSRIKEDIDNKFCRSVASGEDGVCGQAADRTVEVDLAGEYSACAGGIYPLVRVSAQPGCEKVRMGIENGANRDESCIRYIE